MLLSDSLYFWILGNGDYNDKEDGKKVHSFS